MSFGGGGGGGTPAWVLQEHQNQLNKMNDERAKIQAEKEAVQAQADKQAMHRPPKPKRAGSRPAKATCRSSRHGRS